MPIRIRLLASLAVTCVAVAAFAEAPASKAAGNASRGPGGAGAEKGYHVDRVMHIGGEGRWDYITVDAVSKLLYIPRSSHVQVIREETGEVVNDLKETPGVHGVALAPELHRGFTSNGQSKSVTVFDLKTMQVLGTVQVGDNPDAILYDAFSKTVWAFNGQSKDVSVLDATTDPASPAKARIALGSKPEFSVTDGAGRVYVNLEDTNSVAVLDTKTMKLVATWKIEGGEEPTGLAIDIKGHRLFVGCHNQVMAVLDTSSGKSLCSVPIGKGVDACAFDAATGEAFASCGDGTLTVAKEVTPGKFGVVQTVQTRVGARTMGLDDVTHTLYLPTMEFEASAAGDKKRPTPKPDSFEIVVVTPGR